MVAGQVDPNWLLSKGAETGQIVWIARALALYADRNTTSGNTQERAPVHLAVLNVWINSSLFTHSYQHNSIIIFWSSGIGHSATISSSKWGQNKY